MEKSLGRAGFGFLPPLDFRIAKVRGSFGEFQFPGVLGCEGECPSFSFVVWSGFVPGGAQSLYLAGASPASSRGSKAGGDSGFSGALGRICEGDLAGTGAVRHPLWEFV